MFTRDQRQMGIMAAAEFVAGLEDSRLGPSCRMFSQPSPSFQVMAHFVYAGRVGGAEQMLYNLLDGLNQECAALTVVCSDKRNFDPLKQRELEHDGVRILELGGGGPRFVAEQRACLERNLAADVTLFPNYFVPPVTPKRLGRIAAVSHDMLFRTFPQYFTTRKRIWLAAAHKLTMFKADRLIVLSEFCRDEILQTYGSAVAHKIAVIPNAISWRRFEALDGKDTFPPVDRPYILTVAAQYAHKNLPVLIQGFAELAKRNKDVTLVLCGQGYDSLRGGGRKPNNLSTLVEELGLGSRVRITGYVDDATLGRWYRNASVFAYPSLFEGFGMPPVEALGLGLPTITTKCAAIPETTMGLAAYVDNPTDSGEWADRLGDMVRNPAINSPDAADVKRLRTQYDPGRIARAYVAACAT